VSRNLWLRDGAPPTNLAAVADVWRSEVAVSEEARVGENAVPGRERVRSRGARARGEKTVYTTGIRGFLRAHFSVRVAA